MKIYELKKIAEENDYTCWTTTGDFYVFKRKMSMKHIKIKKTECNRIYVLRFDFCDEKDSNMIKACMDLSCTHPDDREEEKKFYLEHRYFKCTNGDSRYFQILESDGTPWLNAMYTVIGYKKQFTLKEIEEIKEEFDTDLADFVLVEVEE